MKIAIYGTGHVAQRIYDELKLDGEENQVDFFIDSLVKKSSFCGKPVVSLSFLESIDVNQYRYYLGSLGSQNSMRRELLSRGVNEDNIILNHDYSEDNFEVQIHDIQRIMFYPPASIHQQEVIVDHVKDFVGEAYNLVSFYFAECKENISDDVDLILVWEKDALRDTRKRTDGKVFCIDKSFYKFIDCRILGRLANKIYKEKGMDFYNEDSRRLYENLQKRNYEKAYVFGNGPSLDEGMEKCIKRNEPCLKIVCNGVVNNGESILKELQPQIYALVDAAYLEESYAKCYLDRIVHFVEENDTFLVVPQFWVCILIHWYPKLRGKIIGLEMTAPHIQFPNVDDLCIYRKAGNVITNIALPIASSMASVVYISGCDGAKKIADENTLWEHSQTAAEDLIVDTNYNKDILEQHNIFFEEFVRYGEEQGKKYYSITTSYIPCLAERLLCE